MQDFRKRPGMLWMLYESSMERNTKFTVKTLFICSEYHLNGSLGPVLKIEMFFVQIVIKSLYSNGKWHGSFHSREIHWIPIVIVSVSIEFSQFMKIADLKIVIIGNIEIQLNYGFCWILLWSIEGKSIQNKPITYWTFEIGIQFELNWIVWL